MTTRPQPAFARPLSRAEKVSLIAGATATILGFYLFALASISVMLALLAVELVALLPLARFGLGGLIASLMERQMTLVGIFFRSFRVGRSLEFRTILQPEEAPGLFAKLKRLCHQLDLTLPAEVAVEMSLNANVRLEGYRQGAGTTILSVGYDLLAGLSDSEVEAVLAHEMAHAKLVRRGLKRWLAGGLNRAANLANGLAALAEAYRRAGRSADHVAPFVKLARGLARRAHRLLAAYSRQDEFEADRGAAELCGAATVRATLIKVESLAGVAARLPWRERVARHHLAEGFSRWLTRELASSDPIKSADRSDAFNQYSTHPPLKDRLAALPAESSTAEAVGQSGLGLDLLAAPDAVAGKLIAEIERVIREEEQKDRKELERWRRKVRNGRRMRPLQVFGVVLIMLGIVGLMYWLFTRQSTGLVAGTTAMVALGFLLFRKGRYRERLILPVPDYAILKKSWEGGAEDRDLQAEQKEMEAELSALVASERKSRKKSTILAARSFEALACCDYLQAHVAARLCRTFDVKSTDGALALAIASAALRQNQQAAWALSLVQQASGLATPSARWGGAWTYLLSGDWGRADALLEAACEETPGEPTLMTLLALCQARRGKLQRAIATARQACSPKPPNAEHAKLLISLLLDVGYIAEARMRLLALEPDLRSDPDLIIAMVRLHMLEAKFDLAEEWSRLLKQVSAGGNALITLGGHYELARRPSEAALFYQQALLLGHYPDALLGLARLEAGQGNRDQARQHLLTALDVKKELGPKAAGPIPLFHRILNQFLALQESVSDCHGWTATLTGGSPEALINKTLLIFASDQKEAAEHLQAILQAMTPGSPPVLPQTILWRDAREEHQPEGPVRPGIQCVLN